MSLLVIVQVSDVVVLIPEIKCHHFVFWGQEGKPHGQKKGALQANRERIIDSFKEK